MSRTNNKAKKIEGQERKRKREEELKLLEVQRLEDEEAKTWLVGAKQPTRQEILKQKEAERLEKKSRLEEQYNLEVEEIIESIKPLPRKF